MSVLGHERWLLREIYIKADEALEMLSSELAKDEQHWISDTAPIYRQAESPEYAISLIANHLATKPIGIFENTNVSRAMAHVMYQLHATGKHLSDLNHEVELAIQEVRDISIQASPEALRSRDDRGQSRGRSVPVSDDVHAQRGDEPGRRSHRQSQNKGDY
jgi:hypothetical protein